MGGYAAELLGMELAARKAGDSLLRDFADLTKLQVVEKNPSDFVSSADLRAQEILQSELSGAFPGYGFLLEEGPALAPFPGARFVIDPLDGTTNFLHGIPHFAVAIALEVAGETVAGVVFDPARNELFRAEKDAGAWLGERRLTVSTERELSRSVLGTGIPHRARAGHARYLEALGRVMPEVAGIRRMGAAALDLAYVAMGRFEGYFDRGLGPWDIAAGALLVQEAGGLVSELNGEPLGGSSGDVLASGGEPLHGALIARLEPLYRH